MRYLITLIAPVFAFAAGNSGHGAHLSDLTFPAINALAFVALIVWKVKGVLKESFIAKAKSITETLERASSKAKEAQAKYAHQMKKNEQLDNEMSKIKDEAGKEVESFKALYADETKAKITKLGSDTQERIQAEKDAGMNKLSDQLVLEIIEATKIKVKSDTGLQSKVTASIVKGI